MNGFRNAPGTRSQDYRRKRNMRQKKKQKREEKQKNTDSDRGGAWRRPCRCLCFLMCSKSAISRWRGTPGIQKDEIKEMVADDKWMKNTVLLTTFHSKVDMSDIPFMNSVEFTFVSYDTICIQVNEKKKWSVMSSTKARRSILTRTASCWSAWTRSRKHLRRVSLPTEPPPMERVRMDPLRVSRLHPKAYHPMAQHPKKQYIRRCALGGYD